MRIIVLNPAAVVANVPLAVRLAETARGTIVDPCAALVSVARVLCRAGVSRVWVGEAADDIFGGFDFARRYYRGVRLRAHFQRELAVGLPDEMAVLQKVFEPWGISVFDPYWTASLVRLGYNLPLIYRFGPDGSSKPVLRAAFADLLAPEVVRRPKRSMRDTTDIRYALECHFGRSRYRYRPIFKSWFGRRAPWRGRAFVLPRKSSRA